MMLEHIFAAEGWREAFWLGLGGLAASAACIAGRWALDMVRGRDEGRAPDRPEEPARPAMQDQLEGVEGIGADIGGYLRLRGIGNLSDLAQRSPAALRSLLDGHRERRFELAEPLSWPLQAGLLATGHYEEFLKLAVALRAGVPGLDQITGIGPVHAQALRLAGIRSIEKLRSTDIGRVVHATGVEADEAGNWIDEADRLYAGDRELLARLANIELPPQFLAQQLANAVAPPPAGPSSPDGDDGSRTWQWPKSCPACCGLLASSLLLLGIIVAEFGGWIPIPPIKPEPVCNCKAPGKLHKELLADQLFGTDDDVLDDRGKPALDKLAQTIVAKAELTGDLPGALVVIGHTDWRRSRGKGGNQGLSERRAKAVSDYLTSKLNGAKENWPPSIVFALGRADSEPHPKTKLLCTKLHPSRDELESCLAYDRRVDVNAFYVERPESVALPQKPASVPAAGAR